MAVLPKIPLHHFRSSFLNSGDRFRRRSRITRGKSGGTTARSSDTKEEFSGPQGDSGDTIEGLSNTKEESSGPQGESGGVIGPKSDFEPPNGWTNDPEEMVAEKALQDAESEGYELLQYLGLKTATPIMSQTRQNGACLHVLESGGNYYIWNIIEGDFRRFQDTCLTDILDTMKKNNGGTKDCRYAKEITPAIESH